MIEFNGYLTDNTLKFYRKRVVKQQQYTFIYLLVFGLPLWTFLFSLIMPLKYVLFVVFPIFAVASILMPYFKLKADKDRFVPKRITINDSIITYVSDKSTDSVSIEQVKQVKDYGEYYALTFVGFGRYSPNFVCQKDLLAQGTLEDFEALFAGKMKKM